MATKPIEEIAPAKINLCLHVVGRRADGYHLLDSLVVFAGVGDLVTVVSGPELTCLVTGPESAGLVDETDNLVLRAARAMGVLAQIELRKDLPVASGMGGGSADAAACLRALARMTGRPLPDPARVVKLGADVPVCLAGKPARMRGIGADLSPLPPMPQVWIVLVNPRQAVPTAAVFAALSGWENPAVPDLPSAGWATAKALADWLCQRTRNDLEAAAIGLAPVIGNALAALSAVDGCLVARMTGSGATCFGLFASPDLARAAARIIWAREPGWWVRETWVHA